ncbi:MAG: DUF4249 domain-containing protein [Bacteroidetes bacterium]|nr:DUF4249 domain-containing protein [Bacteroidota bacterium]
MRKQAYHYKVLKGIGLLIVLLQLVSCLPEPLEVRHMPVAKPEVVVSTQLIPDRTLLVFLSRTFSALEYTEDSDPEELLTQIALNDALVTITGPDGTDTLRFLKEGFYGGIFIPFQEGELYELRIRSESLGEVYAATRVQAQVTIEEAEADLYYNDFGDTLAMIDYSFLDPEAHNWYLLNVQKVDRETAEQNIINPHAFTKLLNDTEFEGRLVEDQFRFTPEMYAPGDTIAFTLSNISEEYYHFMKLRLENRLNLMDFLGEPVNYPSNIVGGKGYFNLYVPDVRFFVLE